MMLIRMYIHITSITKSKSNDALVKCVFNRSKHTMGQKRVTTTNFILQLYWVFFSSPSLQSNPLPAAGAVEDIRMSRSHGQ